MPLLKAIQQLFPKKLAIYPRPRPLPLSSSIPSRDGPSYSRNTGTPFDPFDPSSMPGPLKIACHEEQFSATIPTFLNELHPPLMRKRTFLMRTAFFAVFFHSHLSGPFPLLSRTNGGRGILLREGARNKGERNFVRWFQLALNRPDSYLLSIPLPFHDHAIECRASVRSWEMTMIWRGGGEMMGLNRLKWLEKGLFRIEKEMLRTIN